MVGPLSFVDKAHIARSSANNANRESAGLSSRPSTQKNHDVLTVIEGIHKEREIKQEVLSLYEVSLF
jgi:hypothetical protein